MTLSVDRYVEGVRQNDRAILGRAITLVESTLPEHRTLAQVVLQNLLPHTGRAVRVGITGVPGVGKSSFIEKLGGMLTAQGQKVAVLAIDPSSQRSGGSILGDKTRMANLAADPMAFIRPSPTGGTLGGVARKTREAMLVVEAAGYDVVLVESVGVGQSETSLAEMVDTFLLMLLPGGGDELQGIKRGILELADLVAVHKADGPSEPLARAAQAEYSAALRILRGQDAWVPPVVLASSLLGTGLAELWATVLRHREETQKSGAFEKKRKDQRVRWFEQLIKERLEEHFRSNPAVAAAWSGIEAEVAADHLPPGQAADRLLQLYGAP